MEVCKEVANNLNNVANNLLGSMCGIADSGYRREFTTGAVRDISKGKGRCDLMPLLQIGEAIDDEVLVHVGNYLTYGDTVHLGLAAMSFVEDVCKRDIYEVLLELSIYYERGLEKYGERNWERGIPIHTYIDSGVRHYLKYRNGLADERHDLAFLWNMFGAAWTHDNKPDMLDLPFPKRDDV